MKKVALAVFAALAICGSTFAQTNTETVATATTTNITLSQATQQLWDAITSSKTNWNFEVHGLYASALKDKWGGGAGAFFALTDNVLAGVRLDWVDGGFWMPSGNVTLQLPIRPIKSWRGLVITPITYAGVGVPVSGATFGSITVPGELRNNNGQATAILGVGGAVLLYAPKGGSWSLNAVGDYETWSGFPGSQIRFGLDIHKYF